jgi:hypothetical protein
VSRFRRHGDAIRMELETYEVQLLRDLRDGLREALTRGAPSDPVVARLFSRTVAGDDDADSELRRLIHEDLLTGKLAGLDALVSLLDGGRRRGDRLRVELRDDGPGLVLGVLNDLRLAIGARVGLEHLDRDTVDPDSPTATSLAVMDHLAWLQEQLLAIVDPASVSLYDDLDELPEH